MLRRRGFIGLVEVKERILTGFPGHALAGAHGTISFRIASAIQNPASFEMKRKLRSRFK